MWRNLNLRARMLAAFGVVLLLASALAIFLMVQLGELNRQIAQINAVSAAEAGAGIRLAQRVTEIHDTVESYLNRPTVEARVAVERAFEKFDAEAAASQATLVTEEQRRQYAAIIKEIGHYRQDVTQLGDLLDEQRSYSDLARRALFESAVLASHEISGEFVVSRGGLDSIDELSQAQQSLHMASLLLGQGLDRQDTSSATRALEQVERAHTLLQQNARRPSPSTGLQEAVSKSSAAIVAVRMLADTIGQVRAIRDEHFSVEGSALHTETEALATGALKNLTSATASLERQVYRTQQIAGLALLATIVMAVSFGVQLARTLARPLTNLAGAVERVNAGDYDTFVALRDGGEIGRLAMAFNQMSATLKRQRDEVRRQQEAMSERNRELEDILSDLQASNAAREKLATAVRALSVPVMPIMKHVIAVPLVGDIDAARADVLMDRVLAGVTDELARVVILDITGVPFVDAGLAGWLVKTAAAAELLGARCVLTGISPEVAQALVASGADLGRLVTRADLRGGVQYALEAAR